MAGKVETDFIEEVQPEDLKRGDKILIFDEGGYVDENDEESYISGGTYVEVIALVDGELIVAEDVLAHIRGKAKTYHKRNTAYLKRKCKIYRMKDIS